MQTNTELLPSEMNYEQLLEIREQLNHKIDEIKGGIQALNEELLIKMAAEKITGKVVGNWALSKATRFSFDTTLDQAKELGAVKETVDATKLKALLTKGVAIPGVRKSEYIIVREVEKTKDIQKEA